MKDSDGHNVAAASYTSGSDGLITIAYLSAGTYTLTEIEAPNGFVVLDDPITITIDEDGIVSVGGVDSSYYAVDTETDMNMSAIITIKNRSTEFQVKKIDSETKEALPNVHFALYKQVKDAEGNPRPDYLPMSGYEDIVTGENGVIQEITMNLGVGTYYLRETQAASGYKKFSDDLCFTIGVDGRVSIEDNKYKEWLSRTESEGVVSYDISIPNTPLGITIRKTDEKGKPLEWQYLGKRNRIWNYKWPNRSEKYS